MIELRDLIIKQYHSFKGNPPSEKFIETRTNDMLNDIVREQQFAMIDDARTRAVLARYIGSMLVGEVDRTPFDSLVRHHEETRFGRDNLPESKWGELVYPYMDPKHKLFLKMKYPSLCEKF